MPPWRCMVIRVEREFEDHLVQSPPWAETAPPDQAPYILAFTTSREGAPAAVLGSLCHEDTSNRHVNWFKRTASASLLLWTEGRKNALICSLWQGKLFPCVLLNEEKKKTQHMPLMNGGKGVLASFLYKQIHHSCEGKAV